MKNVIAISIFCLSFTKITRCAPVAKNDPSEIVLRPGMQIQFENRNGSGSIEYKNSYQRMLTIGGKKLTITMIARNKRFRGQLGLYNPASRSTLSLEKSPRIVAVESEMHFATEEQAQNFLIEGATVQDWVYNDSGYVIGFFNTSSRNQVNVTLYRYFIDGKPARFMKGFNNKNIKVFQTP